MSELHYFDTIVIGSGAAGLGLALSLANEARVALISKALLPQSSSKWAQGGIAAVMKQTDAKIHSHIEDTLKAGAGLCNKATVAFVVTEAKAAIEWLMQQGVQFSMQNQSDFHLVQEGGHSERRVFHVADHTGATVVASLQDQVKQHSNITCFEEHTAIDLIIKNGRCQGVFVLDNANDSIEKFLAENTVLATGGASSCFLHTTNPDMTSGDGIAMAYRAGCSIENMEFNQFHPTTLYEPRANSFLITEAVRGEGGTLKRPDGHAFMLDYDERGDLAPRDVVARSILSEMQKYNLDYVLLDVTHLKAERIKELFPTIYERCLEFNIDITKDQIPVVPAAHYTCGGVRTNLHGETDLKNLYAIGEVACTGLHGANRMASNSLLECVVFAMSAAQAIQSATEAMPTDCEARLGQQETRLSPTEIIALIEELRRIMWNKVGIVRCNAGLEEAKKRVGDILQLLNKPYHLNLELIQARNLAQTSLLMIESALLRHESRGLNYNTDYPEKLAKPKDTFIQKS